MTESEVEENMRGLSVVFVMCLGFCLVWPAPLKAQESKAGKETVVGTLIYSPDGGSGLNGIAHVSQHQEIVDEKNYELSTSIRVPSINGGDRLDREITEKSQQISKNQIKVERTVRSQDSNGRFSTLEASTEERELKGSTEEIQRSFFRPDINGKMIAQSVERETIETVSKKQKQKTRALYRPDIEGKLSLSELEEGTETKINDTTVVMESSVKAQDPNGKLSVIGSRRETTTKLGDSSFRKEDLVSRVDEAGVLSLAEKAIETQTVKPDGTTSYQKLVHSRNLTPQIRNLNSSGLILTQRVTGEERKLSDGTIESTTKVETLDPLDQSRGLRLSEIVTETSRPESNGKIAVERIVKTRDVNGNYVVSQRISQIVEPRK